MFKLFIYRWHMTEGSYKIIGKPELIVIGKRDAHLHQVEGKIKSESNYDLTPLNEMLSSKHYDNVKDFVFAQVCRCKYSPISPPSTTTFFPITKWSDLANLLFI
jgi:hypothetical protein